MRPGLPTRIGQALSRPAAEPDGKQVWLAGASFDRAAAATDPAFPAASAKASPSSLVTILVGGLIVLGIALLGVGSLVSQRRR